MEVFVVEPSTFSEFEARKGLSLVRGVVLAESFSEALEKACDKLQGEVPDIEENRKLIDHGIIRVQNEFLAPGRFIDYSIRKATFFVP